MDISNLEDLEELDELIEKAFSRRLVDIFYHKKRLDGTKGNAHPYTQFYAGFPSCKHITTYVVNGHIECIVMGKEKTLEREFCHPKEQITLIQDHLRTWKPLTPTEIFHLAFWINGRSVKDILKYLEYQTSSRNVQAHIYNAGQKLDCHNRGDFIDLAYKKGVLFYFRTLYDLYVTGPPAFKEELPFFKRRIDPRKSNLPIRVDPKTISWS